MRITDNFSANRAVTDLGALRTAIATAQLQVTSGRRFENPSDDPVAADAVMRNTTAQRAIIQYRASIATANRRVSLADGALQQLDQVMTRARELAIQQGDTSITDQQRRQAVGELNELIAQTVTLANTRDGDEYLFGGDQSTTAPYTLTQGSVYGFTTSGASGTRALEIGPNDRMVVAHDGATVFGTASAGVLKSLTDLAQALGSGLSLNVRNAIPAVQAAQQQLQMQVAETGARANRLQMADANLGAFAQQLEANTSDVQDVDLETALSTLVAKQTAYQAAMSATSRVLSMSLTDYLR